MDAPIFGIKNTPRWVLVLRRIMFRRRLMT